ncbi:DUF47 domain-containing protein [Rhodococcus sp. NPDC003322]
MFARFKPKSDVFYMLFTSSSQCIQSGAKTLTELGRPGADHAAVSARMVELEHECDRITHEIFQTLNSSFVTPFDRSDIYVLGAALDDVLDHMEAATQLMSLYGIVELPSKLADVIDTLETCAQVTAEAMPRLSSMKGLEKYWITINELENTADNLYRTFLADLFNGTRDALTVMKLKDVADELEDAADAFEKVSHVVESIVLKES